GGRGPEADGRSRPGRGEAGHLRAGGVGRAARQCFRRHLGVIARAAVATGAAAWKMGLFDVTAPFIGVSEYVPVSRPVPAVGGRSGVAGGSPRGGGRQPRGRRAVPEVHSRPPDQSPRPPSPRATLLP